MEYSVKIDAFEGPLDLLLHLINSLEIDIYDIPVAEITEQYLLYINTMQDLELDVASEYLVMAATLLAIKSKMLLPKHDFEQDEDDYEEEDPRDALIHQLIEYKKYKEVTETFKEWEIDQSFVYTKPPSDLTEHIPKETGIPANLNVSLYDVIGAFQKLMHRKKMQRPLHTKIAKQEVSIEAKMAELLAFLQENYDDRRPISFIECFDSLERDEIVVTFLAILELMKLKKIFVTQEQNFSELYLMLPI